MPRLTLAQIKRADTPVLVEHVRLYYVAAHNADYTVSDDDVITCATLEQELFERGYDMRLKYPAGAPPRPVFTPRTDAYWRTLQAQRRGK